MAAIKKTGKPDGKAAGFCIYLGPSIRGVINHGAMFRGTKAQFRERLHDAIEARPLIGEMIVSDTMLPKARVKLKTPGTRLYVNYHKLAAGKS